MKILIIDDEPLVRRSLERAFAMKGHEVKVAVEGLQGMQVWESEHPDVVFLDVLMPGMTGPQVLQNLEPSLRSSAKVILMSAYTGSGDFQDQLPTSADKFLAKPFDDIFAVVRMAEELVAK